MRLRRFCVVFAVALVSILFLVQKGNATTCTFYANSMPYDFGLDWGPACVQTGPGCRECITTASRGAKACYSDPFDNVIYCYYTGQYPDNQI